MIKERNIIWRRRRERDNRNETRRSEAGGRNTEVRNGKRLV